MIAKCRTFCKHFKPKNEETIKQPAMGIDFTRSDPLYQQIVEDLRGRITSGALAVGDRLGSHRELAAAYDVSLITVKKALAELVREGLLYARVGKGTFVARSVPRAAPAEQKTLGIVLRDLTVPLFSDIVQQVEAHAYQVGYNVMVSMSSGQAEKEERQIERFRKSGVDGLIIASMEQSHRASETIRSLDAAGFPYVMVSYVEDPDLYMVGIDHERGAYLAARHLCEQGYRRIGYVGAETANRLSELREQGYRRALSEAGLAVEEAFVYRSLEGPGWDRLEHGYEAGRRIARERERPDALFVYNDIAALGLQRALLEAGLRIPEDVAVVGFDDIEQARHAPVPLSTVRQPAGEISARAVEMLLGQIAQRPVERRVVLEPELVARASSEAPARRPASEDADASFATAHRR